MEPATARDELAAIRALMAESQGFVAGTWPHQLLWGSLASAALVATWALAGAGALHFIPWVWAAVLSGGWAVSIFVIRDGLDHAAVRNVASRAFAGIWMGLGVAVTLLGALTITTGALDPRQLPGLIAIVFGAGYFASGFVAGMRWLVAVGVAWWVGSVGLLLWGSPHTLLAFALLTMALEVGPALVLRRLERTGALGG